MLIQDAEDDWISRHRGEQITVRPEREKALIQIPFGFYPHSDFEDAVWVILKPSKLKRISTEGRGGRYHLGDAGSTFKLLAPENFLEVHNHQWEVYESFHSKILELIRRAHTGVDMWSKVLNQSIGELSKFKGRVPDSFLKRAENAIINATNTDVPKYKVDTPLAWTGTSRREITLEFHLATSDGGHDILQAIRLMQKYSAIQTTTDNELDIEFPYIWELSTEPEGMLYYRRAAMTSLQVEMKTPYINGKAQIIILSLSLIDMDPLYSSILDDSAENIITVSDFDNGRGRVDVDNELLRKFNIEEFNAAHGGSLGAY